MAVPGTGSTNQSLTFAAAKKVAGKAHTSNQKEVYSETIPSNVQLNTSIIFGQPIPTAVETDTLYQRFSASGGDYTVEYVEFYVESITGTTYDANDGTFGDVGFGGGDESQSPGVHGYQLVLTSSYESNSSNSDAGSGFFVNDQIVHQSNGGLQLVHPLFGPQSGNKYGLSLYTGHPSSGGLQIPTTSPMEWSVDYYNGVIFLQDYRSAEIPRYARGFIYIGKFADEVITEASSSGGGGGGGSGINNVVEDTTPQLGGTLDVNGKGISGSVVSLTGSVRISGSTEVFGVLSASSDFEVVGTAYIGSIVETSERDLKKEINPLTSEINNIMQLNPVNFKWKKDEKYSKGFIADEVNTVYPELVYKNQQGIPKGIEYSKLVSVLVQGIKDLKKELEEQKIKIKDQNLKVQELNLEIQELLSTVKNKK